MKILTQEEEEKEYCDFMDKVAITVCKEFFKGIRSMSDMRGSDYSKELGIAMGQVALDQIIELTKDMPREDLVKLFSEVAVAHVVSAMQDNMGYKLKILHLAGIL